MEHRAKKYEVLKVIKNMGLGCQVRIKYTEWNNNYEQDVDVKDVDLFRDLGREEKKNKHRDNVSLLIGTSQTRRTLSNKNLLLDWLKKIMKN